MARHHSHTGIDYKLNAEGERLYTGLQDLQDGEYAACPYCKEEKVHHGELEYCNHCEVVIEGVTIIWTWEEWSKL